MSHVPAFDNVSLAHAYLTSYQFTISPALTSLISQCLSQLAFSPRAETLLPLPNLLTASNPVSYHVGTGRQLLNYVFDFILTGPTAVEHELLFVTCFWSKSTSLEYLSKTLLELNRLHPLSRGDHRRRKLRIRICISSRSALQKLFHTSSDNGFTYANTARAYEKLGLPPPEKLGNLDIVIKSKFFRPISVLHGKYVIVDRKRLLLPSCNVSWEEWLEGMGVFEGGIVDSYLEYYHETWGGTGESLQSLSGNQIDLRTESIWTPKPLPPLSIQFPRDRLLPTIFLTQPHHAVFPPLGFVPTVISRVISTCLSLNISPSITPAPLTPQNIFMAALVRQARRSIFIQTPNLTCPDLLEVLYERLTRNGESIDIEIITCTKMMFLEQVVTTGFGGPSKSDGMERKLRWGATTESCVNELLRRVNDSISENSTLSIYYYNPLPVISASSASDGDVESTFTAQEEMEMAQQSHVKAMIVDKEVTIIGSANGDRASWFTSGEVNVMVLDGNFAKGVKDSLEKGVGSRRVKVESSFR
ncbi:hypothetical protein BGX38DRAFT_1155982 [Terfezia claveryi]|nr:hypothetical protein BGX38DRAFT_1155982 [Terfezia claveryi]